MMAIDRYPNSHDVRSGISHAATWLVLLLACETAFAADAPPAAALPPAIQPTTMPAELTQSRRQIVVRLVDAQTQQPLSGGVLTYRVNVAFESYLRQSPADDQGVLAIKLPEKEMTYLSIRPFAPGYAPLRKTWSEKLCDKEENIPSQVTIPMTKGVSIGGIIQDEQGQPIPGARVTPVLSTEVNDEARVHVNVERSTVVTDENGRWQTDQRFPASSKERPLIMVECTGYRTIRLSNETTPKYDQLLNKTGVMRMSKAQPGQPGARGRP